MKKYITFPRTAGKHSKQAHCDLPAGTYEREFGREGFFGPVTHIHHANPPTGWTKWEGDLKPHAFDCTKIKDPSSSPWKAALLLHNRFMKFRYWETSGKMDHLVTNADGDELLFVHEGEGSLFCDFGHLRFREGDYITMPRGAKWRVECKGKAKFLLIEATGEGYVLPDRGLVGPNAVFDLAVLDVPAIDGAFKAQQGKKKWNVIIKRGEKFSTVTYPFNPLDAVGWHGDLLPVKLNWRDIRPLMSHRYHLPPSVHTTFLASRFVVCTFTPRPAEMDPGALKVPFYHSNNDFDEILFYHQGNFFSRDNIHAGMVTLHPCGFAHGPHPKAFKLSAEADKKRKMTDPPKMLDEVAVMIDTRDAVEVGTTAKKIEWTGYVESWREK